MSSRRNWILPLAAARMRAVLPFCMKKDERRKKRKKKKKGGEKVISKKKRKKGKRKIERKTEDKCNPFVHKNEKLSDINGINVSSPHLGHQPVFFYFQGSFANQRDCHPWCSWQATDNKAIPSSQSDAKSVKNFDKKMLTPLFDFLHSIKKHI